MRNGIVYFITLLVLVCLTLIVVDVSKVTGFDLDTHPVFQVGDGSRLLHHNPVLPDP